MKSVISKSRTPKQIIVDPSVIVYGAPNSLLEGEPGGGVWLECMPGMALHTNKRSDMANATPATPLLPPLVVVVVGTKIARSRVLGICV